MLKTDEKHTLTELTRNEKEARAARITAAELDQAGPSCMPCDALSTATVDSNIAQTLLALERNGICYACMKPGHFFLDRDADGKYICEKAQQMDSQGLLPKPNNPGKTQPNRNTQRNRRTNVYLVHDQPDDTQDDENVNAPPHGSDDAGAAPEAGSRADEENKDKVDKLAIESLHESYRTQLNFKDDNKKFAVRLPAFFAQEILSTTKQAGCSTFVWDSSSRRISYLKALSLEYTAKQCVEMRSSDFITPGKTSRETS
ncbi:hypothetical protein RI054_44g152620 [Pseudoscourfieldia marina]